MHTDEAFPQCVCVSVPVQALQSMLRNIFSFMRQGFTFIVCVPDTPLAPFHPPCLSVAEKWNCLFAFAFSYLKLFYVPAVPA